MTRAVLEFGWATGGRARFPVLGALYSTRWTGFLPCPPGTPTIPAQQAPGERWAEKDFQAIRSPATTAWEKNNLCNLASETY